MWSNRNCQVVRVIKKKTIKSRTTICGATEIVKKKKPSMSWGGGGCAEVQLKHSRWRHLFRLAAKFYLLRNHIIVKDTLWISCKNVHARILDSSKTRTNAYQYVLKSFLNASLDQMKKITDVKNSCIYIYFIWRRCW